MWYSVIICVINCDQVSLYFIKFDHVWPGVIISDQVLIICDQVSSFVIKCQLYVIRYHLHKWILQGGQSNLKFKYMNDQNVERKLGTQTTAKNILLELSLQLRMWIDAQNAEVLLEITQVNVIDWSIGQVRDQINYCSECRSSIETHTSEYYRVVDWLKLEFK